MKWSNVTNYENNYINTTEIQEKHQINKNVIFEKKRLKFEEDFKHNLNFISFTTFVVFTYISILLIE